MSQTKKLGVAVSNGRHLVLLLLLLLLFFLLFFLLPGFYRRYRQNTAPHRAEPEPEPDGQGGRVIYASLKRDIQRGLLCTHNLYCIVLYLYLLC